MDRTLSGATNTAKRGPGSDGNEGVLHVHQSSSINGVLPSDCLVSYPGHSFGKYYLSAEKPSMYTTAHQTGSKLAGWHHRSPDSNNKTLQYPSTRLIGGILLLVLYTLVVLRVYY